MLESLSGREFEVWVKVLLERHLDQPVEDQPHSGDEGRDLMVKDPTGDIVVECKHYPRGSVGRPVVQKLHSAVLTSGSSRGMVVTTGRFSRPAQEYAESLQDIDIELVDAAHLAYLAETVGLTERESMADRLAFATRTTPDEDFPAVFTDTVFAPPRFVPGEGYEAKIDVARTTEYEGLYVADFHASGSLKTARGMREAAWSGRVWCTHDGRRAGLDEPAGTQLSHRRLVPLGDALELSQGQTDPPGVQPHEAAGKLKQVLLEMLSKTIRYTGRNNVTYTRAITPSRNKTHVDDVRLVYVASHTFVVSGPQLSDGTGVLTRGRLIETGPGADVQGEKPTSFLVWSEDLGVCGVCQRSLDVADQIICAVCLRGTHRKTLLRPDSETCAVCSAAVCRDHARQRTDVDETICVRCAGATGEPLPPRWRPHVIFAIVATVIVLVIGQLWLTESSTWAAVGLAALLWMPAGSVALPGSGTPQAWLRYDARRLG